MVIRLLSYYMSRQLAKEIIHLLIYAPSLPDISGGSRT